MLAQANYVIAPPQIFSPGSSSMMLHSVAVNQITRQVTLQKYCAAKKEKFVNYNKIYNFKDLIYSTKGKLIMCTVHKIASSNWKRVFLAMSGIFNESFIESLTIDKIQSISKSSKLRKVHAQSTITINQTNCELREELFASSNRVLFTRNPYERLFSAYKDKFVPPKDLAFKNIEKKIFRMFPNNLKNLERDATFEEFLEFVIHEHNIGGISDQHNHWRPVTKICLPCHIKYDFIGKMETLIEDSKYVMDLANMENKNLFPAKAGNSAHTRSLVEKAYSNVHKTTLNRLYEIYKEDLEAFAYTVPEAVRRIMNSI